MPVAPQAKSEQAYQWLKDRIGEGDFTPGFRLVLGTIADQLDMSVVPVREAVRRLEAEGFVEFEHNVGARVALSDPDEYAHTMQTLGVVEGIATALSAPLLTQAEIAQATALNDRMDSLLTDFNPATFTQLNQRFHAVLFSHCPNPHLHELVARGWRRLANLRDSSFAFVPERAGQSVAEHRRLLALISQQAPARDIEVTAREHRWATMQALLCNQEKSLPATPSPAHPSPVTRAAAPGVCAPTAHLPAPGPKKPGILTKSGHSDASVVSPAASAAPNGPRTQT